MLLIYNIHLALTLINTVSEPITLCHKIDEAQATKNRHLPSLLNVVSVEPELACVHKVSPPSIESIRDTSTSFENAPQKKIFTNSQHRNRNCRKSSTFNKTPKNKSVVCWSCRQSNHVFTNCTLKKSKFCFKCGNPNKTSFTCSCLKEV